MPEPAETEMGALEQRITAALVRIGVGVDRLASLRDDAGVIATGEDDVAQAVAQTEEISLLQAALDRERAARAEADAALDAMQSPMGGGEHQAEVNRLTRQLDEQGLDNQRLRSSLAQLREDLRRLREAVVEEVVDAALVNRAMQAELESLRAARASEVTEMADILSVLGPLVDHEEARAHAGR